MLWNCDTSPSSPPTLLFHSTSSLTFPCHAFGMLHSTSTMPCAASSQVNRFSCPLALPRKICASPDWDGRVRRWRLIRPLQSIWPLPLIWPLPPSDSGAGSFKGSSPFHLSHSPTFARGLATWTFHLSINFQPPPPHHHPPPPQQTSTSVSISTTSISCTQQ